MHSLLKKHHRVLFYTGWLVINIIQACTTELLDDEAYYWVYSRYPAWGYFDHPPMIAFLIKAGYAIFPNELGVRLFMALANTATIFIISKLIDDRNDKLFYSIAASVALAHIGGMIAVPDIPLLFFVVLFFWVYSKFIEKMNFLNCLLLGIIIALMLYTKYHGILVVLFTLLSNPKLFLKYQTYVVALIAVLLFLPHVHWQYLHDFISLQYHLFERSAWKYRFDFTTEYIIIQVLLAGPFIGWLLIWCAIKYSPASLTERALKFTFIGVYVFFLFSTLKGRVEANWTVPAFVPLIILSHHYLNRNIRLAQWVYKALPLTLFFVLAVRIYMMLDIEPFQWTGKSELHQNKAWVNAVSKKSKGLPVVFLNSYQLASKYWFYTGKPSLSMNTLFYRRNNFNFWPVEDTFFRKKVYVLGYYDSIVLNDRIIASRFSKTGGANIYPYYSFMKAQFTGLQNKVSRNHVTSSFNVEVPAKYLSYFQSHPFDTASIQLAILNLSDWIQYFSSGVTVKQITQTSSHLTVKFILQLPKGSYDARLGISSGVPGHPTLNSPAFILEVKE